LELLVEFSETGLAVWEFVALIFGLLRLFPECGLRFGEDMGLRAATGPGRRFGCVARFLFLACVARLLVVAAIVIVFRTVNRGLSASTVCAGPGNPFKSENALLSASRLLTPGFAPPLFNVEKNRLAVSCRTGT